MGTPPTHAQSSARQRFSRLAWLVLLAAALATQSAVGQVQVGALLALPEAPAVQSAQKTPETGKRPAANASGAIDGTVLDSYGDTLTGVSVTLENLVTNEKRSTLSDANGYFRFTAVEPGSFKLAVTAAGFAAWTETEIPMIAGADLDLPRIELQLATTKTDVTVVFSQYQLAAEQVQIEEKQRIFGVLPNFYTSYVWNAAPLTAGQKFKLAWRSSIDPVSFLASASIAGVQQAQDAFEGYGQGAEGFAKRFAASYGDGLIGTMIGAAALPSIFHQDPRYFYKGTGTVRQRALYAMATTVICKGDNGRWQPNYSNVLGNFAAGGLSNLYYPKDERNGFTTTLDNALIGTAAGAVGALFQEFLLRRLTPGAKSQSPP